MFGTDYITRILLTLPGIIIGFSMHEFGHAIAAHKLGDPTPEKEGKLTLSPRAHIDPLGILLIALVGFGWAKPVMIQPSYFKNPRRDGLIVSLAGPMMNLVTAFAFLFIFKLLSVLQVYSILGPTVSGITATMLQASATINLFLMFFNLIPLAPLDGFSVLAGLIPYRYYRNIEFLEIHGQTILMVLIVASFAGFNILYKLIEPPMRITYIILSELINLIPG